MAISNKLKAALAALPLLAGVVVLGPVSSAQASDCPEYDFGGLNVWGPMPGQSGNVGLGGGRVSYLGGTCRFFQAYMNVQVGGYGGSGWNVSLDTWDEIGQHRDSISGVPNGNTPYIQTRAINIDWPAASPKGFSIYLKFDYNGCHVNQLFDYHEYSNGYDSGNHTVFCTP
ncbi:hypothetical protein GCM10010193_14410 [Kitasatospora atroaurantiaca]|uniref:Uncharacterized protein n=1 Tax=Kitasatospora atroaurantiaca TaxID=285545 RepID=A0A561F244_9ACTN|nr:hypothetical protein [Kitasatospora atroaurantiaca]TWE21930.1 hypothetical protein FB465_7187 [Kitasatospora atroaurantiaca]